MGDLEFTLVHLSHFTRGFAEAKRNLDALDNALTHEWRDLALVLEKSSQVFTDRSFTRQS
jgi:hypothetical protein